MSATRSRLSRGESGIINNDSVMSATFRPRGRNVCVSLIHNDARATVAQLWGHDLKKCDTAALVADIDVRGHDSGSSSRSKEKKTRSRFVQQGGRLRWCAVDVAEQSSVQSMPYVSHFATVKAGLPA